MPFDGRYGFGCWFLVIITWWGLQSSFYIPLTNGLYIYHFLMSTVWTNVSTFWWLRKCELSHVNVDAVCSSAIELGTIENRATANHWIPCQMCQQQSRQTPTAIDYASFIWQASSFCYHSMAVSPSQRSWSNGYAPLMYLRACFFSLEFAVAMSRSAIVAFLFTYSVWSMRSR